MVQKEKNRDAKLYKEEANINLYSLYLKGVIVKDSQQLLLGYSRWIVDSRPAITLWPHVLRAFTSVLVHTIGSSAGRSNFIILPSPLNHGRQMRICLVCKQPWVKTTVFLDSDSNI